MPPGRTGNVSGSYYGLELTPEEEALLYGDPAAAPPPPQGGGYATEPQGGNDTYYATDYADPAAPQYTVQDPAATAQPYQAQPSLPAPESAAYLPSTTPSSPTMDQRASNSYEPAGVLQNLYGPTPMQNGSTYIPASQRNNAGVDNIQAAPELNQRSQSVGDIVGGAANDFITNLLDWATPSAGAEELVPDVIENPMRPVRGSARGIGSGGASGGARQVGGSGAGEDYLDAEYSVRGVDDGTRVGSRSGTSRGGSRRGTSGRRSNEEVMRLLDADFGPLPRSGIAGGHGRGVLPASLPAAPAGGRPGGAAGTGTSSAPNWGAVGTAASLAAGAGAIGGSAALLADRADQKDRQQAADSPYAPYRGGASDIRRLGPQLPLVPAAAPAPPSGGLGTPTLDWMMDAQQEAEDMGLLDAAGNIIPSWVGLITHDRNQVDRARQTQDAMGQTDSSPAGRAAKEAVDSTINPTVERIAGALTQGIATSAAGNTSIPRAQQGTPRSLWGLSAGDRRNISGAVESALRPATTPTTSTQPTTPATPANRSSNRSTTSNTSTPNRMATGGPRGQEGFTDVYGTRGGDPVLQELKGILQGDGTLDKNGNISTQGMTDFKTLGWVDSSGRWTEKANTDGAVDGDKIGSAANALHLRPKGTAKPKAVPEYDPANDPNATTPSTGTASNDSGWVDYGSNKKSGWVDYGSGGRRGGGGYSAGGYSGGGRSGGFGGGGGDMAAALAFLGDDFMGGRFKDMMRDGDSGDMSWESFLEDMDGDGEFSASEIKAAKRKSKMRKGSRSRRTKTPSTSGHSANFEANGAIRKDILQRVEGMTPSGGKKKKSG